VAHWHTNNQKQEIELVQTPPEVILHRPGYETTLEIQHTFHNQQQRYMKYYRVVLPIVKGQNQNHKKVSIQHKQYSKIYIRYLD
jgi:hypothetical protein